jgi:hypothetical protein
MDGLEKTVNDRVVEYIDAKDEERSVHSMTKNGFTLPMMEFAEEETFLANAYRGFY